MSIVAAPPAAAQEYNTWQNRPRTSKSPLHGRGVAAERPRTSRSPLRNRGTGSSPSEMDMIVQAHRAVQHTQVPQGRAGDAIEVGDFPTITGLANWKGNFEREFFATAGRMDDEAAAWARPVLNLHGDALEALGLTQVADEFRSLDAKLSSALGTMCERHGAQKSGTFYHALLQDMKRTTPRRDPSCLCKRSSARSSSPSRPTIATQRLGC